MSHVDESAGRTLELPSLFWASFIYVAYRTELFFDEVFLVLRVTQRVALLDETKNGSGVALRDEGKNGSGRRLSIRTVTSLQTVFRGGLTSPKRTFFY